MNVIETLQKMIDYKETSPWVRSILYDALEAAQREEMEASDKPLTTYAVEIHIDSGEPLSFVTARSLEEAVTIARGEIRAESDGLKEINKPDVFAIAEWDEVTSQGYNWKEFLVYPDFGRHPSPGKITAVKVGGLDPRDYPDLVDAFVEAALWKDTGLPLTEAQLDWFNENCPDAVYDYAREAYNDYLADLLDGARDAKKETGT